MAKWAVERRIPDATGRAAAVFSWLSKPAKLDDPTSRISLSAVLVGFSVKQANAWVDSCSSLSNLNPLVGELAR